MKMNETNEKLCPLCGGRGETPGCPECYRIFEAKFAAKLSALYGSPTHRGSVPKRFDESSKRERRIAELRAALTEAISSEEFERACTLRDALREAQGGLEVKSNVLV